MPEHRNEIANNLCNFNNPRSIRSPDVVTAHRPLHHPRIVRPESERRGCPNSQTMPAQKEVTNRSGLFVLRSLSNRGRQRPPRKNHAGISVQIMTHFGQVAG
jgi:hypothetical protein